MILEEALKLCLDGKKITFEPDYFYVYWDGRSFRYVNVFEHIEEVADDIFDDRDGWEIYNETVDFAEAWKARKAGKTIKSNMGMLYYPNTCPDCQLCLSEIDGRWLILEE